jgi:hypothetical protein
LQHGFQALGMAVEGVAQRADGGGLGLPETAAWEGRMGA